MGLIDKVKDALVPQTGGDLHYQCTNCGETFEESHHECPSCGSTEIKEEGGFELRPQE